MNIKQNGLICIRWFSIAKNEYPPENTEVIVTTNDNTITEIAQWYKSENKIIWQGGIRNPYIFPDWRKVNYWTWKPEFIN